MTIRPSVETTSQNTSILKIGGMTCGHCVFVVHEELNEVQDVSNVEVILAFGGTSTATVNTKDAVENSVFEAAATRAGYSLVSASS